MSHLDGELSAGAFAAGLGASWAARATGINATIDKAATRISDFDTREYMRLSSAIKLNGQMKKAVCERKPRLELTQLRTMAGC
jgi:hypothetical protein